MRSERDPAQVTSKPFLWGPVKSALIQDAKANGPDTIRRLCFAEEPRVREMMVAALTELGNDNPEMVERVLDELFPQEKEPGTVRRAWHLIRKSTPAPDTSARGARQIAVEVAGNLGTKSQDFRTILQRAALHQDPSVRTATVRSIYHLWEREREAGFEILEQVSKKIMHGPIPDLAALESCMGLSMIIFFDHTQEAEVRGRLQGIWREIINKVLGIKESGSRIGNATRGFIRDRVINIALGFTLKILRELPPYNPLNYADLEEFFRKPREEKELYRRLVRYLDLNGNYTEQEWQSDCRAAIPAHNVLIQSVVVLGLNARVGRDPLGELPFLKSFFDEAVHEEELNSYPNALPVVPMYVLGRYPDLDPMFDFLVHSITVCQNYYTKLKNQRHPGMHAIVLGPEAMFISGYVLHQYQRSGTVKTEWLESRIEAAFARNDEQFFQSMVDVEMRIVGYELRKPRSALDAISILFDKANTSDENYSWLRETVQKYLAQLRVLYPEEVDDFLEEHHALEEMTLFIRTQAPVETVGEMIGTRSYNFVMEIIESNPNLRRQLMQMLAQAADCKDARTWIIYVLRQVVNWVYGGEALPLSDRGDSASRA